MVALEVNGPTMSIGEVCRLVEAFNDPVGGAVEPQRRREIQHARAAANGVWSDKPADRALK